MVATSGPSIPRGPAAGVDSAESGSVGVGVALAFDEVCREVDAGAGVALDSDSSVAGVFLSAVFDSVSSGFGVDDLLDFFFEDEGVADFELAVFGVDLGVASALLEDSAGVGFGVDLRDWELPDFFFDSAPAAISTKLDRRTNNGSALRIME
jgi:hypothetical protein